MKKCLAILGFCLVFSQPLIGIPVGIILGTHAALYCADTPSLTCITEQIEMKVTSWVK